MVRNVFRKRSTLCRLYLIFEFVALFAGLPTMCALGFCPIYPIMALWIFSTICLIVLILDQQFSVCDLWRINKWKDLIRIFIRFALAAILLGGYMVVFEPDYLFNFPRYRPFMWAMVMILYPIFSVCPQGLTHRAFLFHRYRGLFKGWPMIFASATAFSYMHIVFKNPVALLLTFAGGILFAKTYEDTRSLVISLIEHALYGNYLFTIGFGKYLYLGAAGYGLTNLP
jgi:membrane protease YdiL (CAAX protease family)